MHIVGNKARQSAVALALPNELENLPRGETLRSPNWPLGIDSVASKRGEVVRSESAGLTCADFRDGVVGEVRKRGTPFGMRR